MSNKSLITDKMMELFFLVLTFFHLCKALCKTVSVSCLFSLHKHHYSLPCLPFTLKKGLSLISWGRSVGCVQLCFLHKPSLQRLISPVGFVKLNVTKESALCHSHGEIQRCFVYIVFATSNDVYKH